jgi:excisionase family DNA binding protein
MSLITLDGVLTVAGAAARHGMSSTTVQKAIARGELPAVRVGAQLFVKPADLDRWATSRVDRRARQR